MQAYTIITILQNILIYYYGNLINIIVMYTNLRRLLERLYTIVYTGKNIVIEDISYIL